MDHEQSIAKMPEKYIPHNTMTWEFLSPELFANLGPPKDDIERAKAQQFAYSSLVGAEL